MTHIITSLCLRDSGCVEVCPVECIVPGKPTKSGPGTTSIPTPALTAAPAFPNARTKPSSPKMRCPSAYTAKGSEYISKLGLSDHYEGTNHHGEKVVLDCVQQLEAGEAVDLTADIQANYDYFKSGTGYKALEL